MHGRLRDDSHCADMRHDGAGVLRMQVAVELAVDRCVCIYPSMTGPEMTPVVLELRHDSAKFVTHAGHC